MNVSLTQAAAKDLGRTLRFIRHGRNQTIHDLGKVAGLSTGYIQNLEAGVRSNASEESYLKMAQGLGVPEAVIQDLLLKARVAAALERRGLTGEQRTNVMRGFEALLVASGVSPSADIAQLVSNMMR